MSFVAESQLNSISENIRYLKTLDPINAQIIRECCRQGPNNLSSIARSLKIPIETVRYRFRKLRELRILQFDVFARYSKLGLTRCSLFANATANGGSQLENTCSAIPYWTYLTRCFGKDEGFYGVYALPYANRSDFESYWREAVSLGILKDFQTIFTGDPHTATPNFQLFNFKKHCWVFQWEEWIEETRLAPTKSSHPALKDPQAYKSEVDLADLQILALLELDATRGMSEIGKRLGFTTSGVKYHWDNHIAHRGVVEGYRTVTLGYPLGFSDLFAFHFRCGDAERLAQLVNFLSDKVFVVSFAKVLRENELIAHIFIPKSEFEGMMQYMYGIRRAGVFQDFSYVKLDLNGYSMESLSPSNYESGYWKYDLDKHLEKLRSLTTEEPKKVQHVS